MTRRWTIAQESAGGGPGSFGIYPLTFGKDSTSSNYYSGNFDSNMSSQYTPKIVPVDSTLFLGTFSNRRTGVDINLQLLAAPIGTQNSSAVTILNWSFTNKRHITECFSIAVNACDKLALFVNDQGTNPNDPEITFWFRPTTDDCVECSDNFSSHFPSTGGTTST